MASLRPQRALPHRFGPALPTTTLSPTRRHFKTPPRCERCCASSSFFWSCSAQKGTKEQWADPVTGSSKIVACGVKNRDTKSQLISLCSHHDPTRIQIDLIELCSVNLKVQNFLFVTINQYIVSGLINRLRSNAQRLFNGIGKRSSYRHSCREFHLVSVPLAFTRSSPLLVLKR